ncbi:MAG: LysR family transcriptional regulator [Clostridia bacterium]|nr:LysR family transcriptional regulator [Clostridia bacterium]
MNEEQIRTFLSIIKRGSFSAAAQEMFMSQPAVTHRVKTLEEELGVPLFVRDNARAVLTPAGQVFLKEAQSLENAFRRAHASVSPFSQGSILRIGFPSIMMLGECRAFFAVMKLAGLSDNLTLHSVLLENPSQNLQKLLSGDVDLVFSDIDPVVYNASQFNKRILFHCTAYACVHKDHRWASLQQIPVHSLQEETVFRYRDSTHFSAQFSSLLREFPLMKTTKEFDTITQALAMLTAREGVVITNGKWTSSSSHVYLPLAPDISMRIGVIWLKKRSSSALRLLVDRIGELPGDIWRI